MNKQVIDGIKEIGWHAIWLIPFFIVYAIYKNTVGRLWLWMQHKRGMS